MVWQRLLTYLALLNALGIGIHLVLQALLLHLGLHFQLLVQHPFLLLLLAHHLRLHTLLAGNDITLLVRVIQGIQGLCERGKGYQCCNDQKLFHGCLLLLRLFLSLP